MPLFSLRAMANFRPARIERQNTEPVSELLKEFVAVNRLGRGLYSQAVFQLWDDVSGVGMHSMNKYLRNKVLYVTVSSSVLRSQLLMQKDFILEEINSRLDTDETVALSGVTDRLENIVLR